MEWFLLVNLSNLIWASCNHLDKFLLESFLKDVKAGSIMFLTAIASASLAVIVFLIKPDVVSIDLKSAMILLFGGAAYFLALFPYIFALKTDEASRVVPLFQLQPVISFVLAYIFLNESLHAHQILAGLLIMIGSIAISLDLDDKFRLKKAAFFWMLCSASLFALNGLLFKFAARDVGYWPGFFFLDSGAAITGLIIFVSNGSYRRDFTYVYKKHGKYFLLAGFLNEYMNITARLVFNYAILLAPLALAVAVGGLQSLFVLILGILITILWPRFGEESLLRHHMLQKALSIAAIFVGTYVLFR